MLFTMDGMVRCSNFPISQCNNIQHIMEITHWCNITADLVISLALGSLNISTKDIPTISDNRHYGCLRDISLKVIRMRHQSELMKCDSGMGLAGDIWHVPMSKTREMVAIKRHVGRQAELLRFSESLSQLRLNASGTYDFRNTWHRCNDLSQNLDMGRQGRLFPESPKIRIKLTILFI